MDWVVPWVVLALLLRAMWQELRSTPCLEENEPPDPVPGYIWVWTEGGWAMFPGRMAGCVVFPDQQPTAE